MIVKRAGKSKKRFYLEAENKIDDDLLRSLILLLLEIGVVTHHYFSSNPFDKKDRSRATLELP